MHVSIVDWIHVFLFRYGPNDGCVGLRIACESAFGYNYSLIYGDGMLVTVG